MNRNILVKLTLKWKSEGNAGSDFLFASTNNSKEMELSERNVNGVHINKGGREFE